MAPAHATGLGGCPATLAERALSPGCRYPTAPAAPYGMDERRLPMSWRDSAQHQANDPAAELLPGFRGAAGRADHEPPRRAARLRLDPGRRLDAGTDRRL